MSYLETQNNNIKTVPDNGLISKRINYEGKYIPREVVEEIRSGVITALTGSGKTSAFEGKAFTLILVPRTIQATMNQRESTYELMCALQEGSVIITYEKFLGHMNVIEFNDMVQNGVYRIIVDEAHTLVSKKIAKYRAIYALNAIFLSGTIDETFRPDLTHYKFIPEQRTPIYWTDGIIPDFENGLYFLDKAKALMRHYPNNCIVGAEHKHNNVDPHTHIGGRVFATSAIREGVSISNDVFDASIVVANHCYNWSTKDVIQAVNRVRKDDAIKIVTKPIENVERQKATTEWAVRIVNRAIRSNDRNVNSIDGVVLGNKLIQWGTTEGFIGVCPYGVACFLAMLNANHYDEELYEFVEYTEPMTPLLINTKTANVSSEDETMLVIEFGGKKYTFEPRYEKRMLEWMRIHIDGDFNTLIPKLMKLSSLTSLNDFYRSGNIARRMTDLYNKTNRKRKYNREKFIKDISKIVEVEMFNEEGKEVKRFNKNIDYKTLKFQVVSACPVPCEIE